MANAGDRALGSVTVVLVAAPEWFSISPERVVLDGVAGGEEAVAVFGFGVDRAAPVGEPGEVVFEIRDAAGAALGVKPVRLAVEAPRVVALHPSYPNPFGGTTGQAWTTVAFEVPEPSRVTLVVFDLLGRRVATLVEEVRAPGRHEVVWDARDASSGLYVVQLLTETPDGRRARKVQPVMRLR